LKLVLEKELDNQQQKEESDKQKKNKFHNFTQRDYDYDALMHTLNGLE
jgi:hypothetical protein